MENPYNTQKIVASNKQSNTHVHLSAAQEYEKRKSTMSQSPSAPESSRA